MVSPGLTSSTPLFDRCGWCQRRGGAGQVP